MDESKRTGSETMDNIGELIGYAVAYPLIGLIVMMAGWAAGEAVKNMPTASFQGALSRYGTFFILGFIADAVAWAAYGYR